MPSVFASVKLEAVIVVGSMVRENVAVGLIVVAMFVALFAGVVEDTDGGVGVPVVNVHETGAASAFPSAALTVIASCAVKLDEAGKGPFGRSFA